MQTVTIPEKVKEEFKDWYMSQWFDSSSFYSNFWKLHYPFQSGIYRSFLRSVGIRLETYKAIDEAYIGQINGKTVSVRRDYTEVEISAINAGFELRAQQLEIVKA